MRPNATLRVVAITLSMASPISSSAQTPNEVGASQIHVLAGSSHAQKLTPISGTGEGIVNVSPEASRDGFSVEIQVAVFKTSPNTVFNVKRAVDFTVDGICTNSQFLQLPLPTRMRIGTAPARACALGYCDGAHALPHA